MDLRVAFVGFPGLEAIVGGKEAEVEVAGSTLEDVLAALEQAYGATLLRALCHEGNKIDTGVLVLRNDTRIDGRDLAQRLADGDRISFVRMVAGG